MTHSRPIRSLRTPFRKGAHARRPWPYNGLARRAAAAELGGILPHATHAIGGGLKKRGVVGDGGGGGGGGGHRAMMIIIIYRTH